MQNTYINCLRKKLQGVKRVYQKVQAALYDFNNHGVTYIKAKYAEMLERELDAINAVYYKQVVEYKDGKPHIIKFSRRKKEMRENMSAD